MTTLPDVAGLAASFATPNRMLDSDVFEEIAQAFVHALQARLVSALHQIKEADLALRVEQVDTPADCACWTPALGLVWDILREKDARQLKRAAAQFLLVHLCLGGADAEDFNISLEEAGYLVFGGHHIRAAKTIALDGGSLTIIQDDGTAFSFHADDAGVYHLIDDSERGNAQECYAFHWPGGNRTALLYWGNAALDAREWHIAGSFAPDRSYARDVQAHVRAALSFLSELGDDYINWASLSIRELLLCAYDADTGMVMSGSGSTRPGLIILSTQPHPQLTIEQFAHEAAHEYLYFIERFCPVEDGTDKNEYHSPIVNQMRPLHAVLLAYHAIINILRVHHVCLEKNLGSADIAHERIRHYARAVYTYEKALGGNAALTQSGRALYDALRKEREAMSDLPLPVPA